MRKSIAVLGLGKYGLSLAQSMYDMGSDVLIADIDEDKLKESSRFATSAICADLSNEDEVKNLGLKNLDIVVVAMSRNLAASIMSVAVAKEEGVPLIVAKSSSDRMTSILEKIGADKVIIPEEYGGKQSARILSSDTFLDYFQVDNSLSMVEMNPMDKWVGKNLIELNIRQKYNVNVVAIKEGGHWITADPKRELRASDQLLIVAERDSLKRIDK
ncbi:potassium channel family protein [Butyrivibrio sp. XPD2002]|uniref:potassium channel family protein n=1 Tax=Butyrivibrio sp. XPD2002 TaxID=1280665 RepID=UPI00041EF028|nr:TrkA family potassium uptake protein [Butyrivibrio sp. XPD2002]